MKITQINTPAVQLISCIKKIVTNADIKHLSDENDLVIRVINGTIYNPDGSSTDDTIDFYFEFLDMLAIGRYIIPFIEINGFMVNLHNENMVKKALIEYFDSYNCIEAQIDKLLLELKVFDNNATFVRKKVGNNNDVDIIEVTMFGGIKFEIVRLVSYRFTHAIKDINDYGEEYKIENPIDRAQYFCSFDLYTNHDSLADYLVKMKQKHNIS